MELRLVADTSSTIKEDRSCDDRVHNCNSSVNSTENESRNNNSLDGATKILQETLHDSITNKTPDKDLRRHAVDAFRSQRGTNQNVGVVKQLDPKNCADMTTGSSSRLPQIPGRSTENLSESSTKTVSDVQTEVKITVDLSNNENEESSAQSSGGKMNGSVCVSGESSRPDGVLEANSCNHRPKRDRVQERMNDVLLTAVYDSKPIEDLQKLMDRGGQVTTRCRDSGASLLHVAALNSDSGVVEFLIAKGADVRARDKFGRQAVHVAAWEGALSVLQVLCRVDVEMMQSAVMKEEPYILQHPDSWNHKHENISRFWNVMDVINEGSTPLHVACRRTKESCVKFLVEAGADPLREDAKGLYPVDVIGMDVGQDAVNRTTSSNSSEGSVVGIAKLLISRQNKESNSTGPERNTKKGWLRLRRLFSVEDHDVRPVTALHTAVNDNNLSLISVLLDEGADVLIWNEDGQTPLHLAVRKKFLDALCLMLRHGDNKERRVVDAKDAKARSLLHLAVEEEWTDGVSVLLEENADITCKTDERRTVIHIVAKNGNTKILTELLTVPESDKIVNAIDNDCFAPIHVAVEKGNLKCVELLVIGGAKADALLPDGRTLLHLATHNNSLELLTYLMNLPQISKLKENKTSVGDGGKTALHIAASLGHSDVVELLLNYGCDLAAKTADASGSTALHLAAQNGRSDTIRKILFFDTVGLCLESEDSHGWYPLHMAAGHGHEEAVDIMLRAGADIAQVVKDEQGTQFTGLDIIMTCVHRPVDFLVQILDSYIMVDDKVPVTNPQCKIEVDFDFLLPRCGGSKQLGVMEAVLNNGSDELEEAFFLHPIVQTFIYLKSKNMFVFFALFFDLFFLLALYLSVIAYHGSFTLRQPAYRYVLVGLLSINMLVEIVNIVRLQRYYLKDVETWIKWCVYLNIMFIVIHPTDWVLRYNMALCILLSWTQLLLIIAKYPAWGIYVLMFATVAATILKVLVVFSLLLVGFAFTFRALFQEQGPFNSIWSSMVKVIIMVYELDYRGTMEEMGGEDQTFLDVARGLYLVFVLMVSLSLVNLMLGLAVSDIAELKRKGRAKRLAKQVAFLGGLENLLFSWPVEKLSWARRHRSAPQGLVVKAGTSLGVSGESPVPRYLKEIIIDKARSVQQNFPKCFTQFAVQQEETTSIGTRKSLVSSTHRLLSP